MKMEAFLLGFITLLLFFIITTMALPDEDVYQMLSDPRVVFTYNRLPEVEKHCRTFLSSASTLEPGDDIVYQLMRGLSFQNGEWQQDPGHSLLMPFEDISYPISSTTFPTPLKLVSFDVKNVSLVRHFRNAVSVGGTLLIGITRESSFVHAFNNAPNFVSPGKSGLTFAFEGIYTESDENGGERRLCLMGKSTLSSGKQFDSESNSKSRAGLLENDQILLVLRYPMTFNLTRKYILGEMKSLNEQVNPKYFDTVRVSSQLTNQVEYQFSSSILESATCSPYLYRDEMMEEGFEKINASEVCHFLGLLSFEGLSILENYKYSGKYVHGNRLEHILFGKDQLDVGGTSYEVHEDITQDLRLLLQYVSCEPDTTNDSSDDVVKVSAIVRAFPAKMDPNVVRMLTGPSGLTLYAEGMWNSSTGQLCMIGFPGAGRIDAGLSPSYSSQISLYTPRALSIRQRSIVYGKISRTREDIGSEVHLLFDDVISPSYFREWHSSCYLPYNYSKLSNALAFRKRAQQFAFFNYRKYFFSYPSLSDGEEPRRQLDGLFNELIVEGYVDSGRLSGHNKRRFFSRMEVVSLGPFLRGYNKDCLNMILFRKEKLLDISTQLVFKELIEGTHELTPTSYKNISQLFLEGVYDPTAGEMHLIACRKAEIGSSNTERGLDCLIEVKVQCQSKDGQWLANPIARITITSQRNKDDPLHFGSISLHILMTRYKDDTKAVVVRKIFEGAARIPVLLGAIAVTAGQLKYMNKQTHIVPYVCIVMLGLQVLGYGISLITGSETFFKSSEPESYMHWTAYNKPDYGLFLKVLDYARQLLLLLPLLLTARILQKISKSWHKPLENSIRRHLFSPHNKLVLSITSAIYTPVFLAWLIVYRHSAANLEFISVIQDFFLLPQILSNILWQKHVKSLCKRYYIGLTLLRFSSNLYEFVSDPILGYSFDEADFLTLKDKDDSAKFAKIEVMVIMLVLAAILHIQQNLK